MQKSVAKSVISKSKAELKSSFPPKHIEPYQYWGKLVKIIDGDTYELEVALGFNITVHERFRLLGVNTPEIHGVKINSAEYKRGMKTMEYINTILHVNDWVEIKVYYNKKEKYGRWLCDMYVGQLHINASLLEKELAEPMNY